MNFSLLLNRRIDDGRNKRSSCEVPIGFQCCIEMNARTNKQAYDARIVYLFCSRSFLWLTDLLTHQMQLVCYMDVDDEMGDVRVCV